MKPVINHLKARTKQAHYRLDNQNLWWLSWSYDRPDQLVGRTSALPIYAQVELSILEAEPQLGNTRESRHIDTSLMFFPDDDHNGIPHDQNVDWLRHYKRPDGGDYTIEHGYMVVTAVPGDETCPVEIWESTWVPPARVDLLSSPYRLVWKAPPDDAE